ncbi:glycosyltransferase [Patescibacteria group bacterium]|nr:glycosyltransferase [Patescibacteria group bacterium]
MSVKISVIIVTYNRANLLAAAIDSVLAQTFRDFELFVVDDCSTDNTGELMKKYLIDERVKYFKIPKQKSIAAVRNFIWPHVHGKYVAILDSDDIWVDQNKLQKQYDFLEENHDVLLLGGAAIQINENGDEVGRIQKPLTDAEIKKEFFVKNPFFHSSVMYRLDSIQPPLVYDNNISFGEDWDLWMRLGETGRLCNLPDYLIKYRVHSDNETKKHSLQAVIDVLRVIKKYRRRYNQDRSIYWQKIWSKIKEYIG